MTATPTSAEVRAELDHPVIDADGHLQEMTNFLRDDVLAYARDFGGAKLVARIERTPLSHDEGMLRRWFDLSDTDRRDQWEACTAWWSMPTRTVDRAMAYLPSLLAEHLDVMGIDYSILYPSMGLGLGSLADDDIRHVGVRVFNTTNAEIYKPFRDRLEPVAVIPMVNPTEAIEELDHCVNTLGFKTAVMAWVRRPIAAAAHDMPDAARWAARIDTFGIDSEYDYDPLWRRCEDLGVAIGFHSSDQGQHLRRSISRYSYNHIGCFAAASDALAKSLFFGGVTHRFPRLNFAFLEGGVGWACTLLADMVGHWEKRGGPAIRTLDPATLDIAEVERLFARHAPERFRSRLDQVKEYFARPQPRPAELDDWSACAVASADDIVHQFTERFYFGCEADDPINAWAFNRATNPRGATLRAIFGSDIGHWDVPNVDEVLAEAHELVDDGLLTRDDFRDFVFTNPARLYTENNPGFFSGTRVEKYL